VKLLFEDNKLSEAFRGEELAVRQVVVNNHIMGHQIAALLKPQINYFELQKLQLILKNLRKFKTE
jgi:hypothetical protein